MCARLLHGAFAKLRPLLLLLLAGMSRSAAFAGAFGRRQGAPAELTDAAAAAPRVDLPPLASPRVERGIATCLPARAIGTYTLLVAELRKLGCTLPIVVYHYEGEYSAADLARARRIDAQTTVAVLRKDPRLSVGDFAHRYSGVSAERAMGFACKPLALMQAPFHEVMLMDYDVLFLRNPQQLFASKGFARTGTLFFFDRPNFGSKRETRRFRRFLDRSLPKLCASARRGFGHLPAVGDAGQAGCPSAFLRASGTWAEGRFMGESGVALVSKRRQPRMLAVLRASYLQIMRVTYGDKESFWLAAEIAGSAYAFSDFAAGFYAAARAPGYVALSPQQLDRGEQYLCAADLAHFHPDSGDVMFFHGDMLKVNYKDAAFLPKYVTLAQAKRVPTRHLGGWWCEEAATRPLDDKETAAISARRANAQRLSPAATTKA